MRLLILKLPKVFLVSCIILIFGLSSCIQPLIRPKQTQLQIRQFQTREYESTNTKMIMKAVLNVLQDEGFIVKNAVVDLGLITATKEYEADSGNNSFSSSIFLGGFGSRIGSNGFGFDSGMLNQPQGRRHTVIESSVNISEFGKTTRVRINFEKKLIDGREGVLEVSQIEDGLYYQDFFSKVDKGVFLQKEKL